jgi:hypothetical protein
MHFAARYEAEQTPVVVEGLEQFGRVPQLTAG